MRRIHSVTGAATLFAALIPAGLRADEPTPPKPAPSSTPTAAQPEAKLDLDSLVAAARGGGQGGESPAKKYRDFGEVMKDSEKIDGLFTLHRKDEHLYAEIKPNQFDQPLLAPIVIARGMAMAGQPLNFGDEWVIVFHRAGDKVQLIRRNIHYKATDGTPIGKAVKQNYTDSILMALPIVALNPAGGMSVVIDLSEIFLSNFAELPFGAIDRSRTTWHKIKAYPNNLELQVEATFGGGRGGRGGRGDDGGVVDTRGVTMVVHYSLVRLPDGGYRPRLADDRVGHFLSATRDFANADPDTTFVRQVNRWRLEKADPKAKLSPPKKQLVFWVEDNVPVEYRPFVQDGIEEWNKAFEKIGFRKAIDVRWQREGDEFDPEDVNYCTFRWITTNNTFAMSCLRANPLTGEMIDGDVIFDAGFIRSWKQEYALMTGNIPAAEGGDGRPVLGEIVSPILAAKKGFGLPTPLAMGGLGDKAPELVPSDWSAMQLDLRRRMAGGMGNACQYNSGLQAELGLAALALAEAGKAEPNAQLPEEFLGQAIKEVVMHEVGHSLGLRHNFKASTMLTADQLHDTAITREKGLVGSVMDYSPINIAAKGSKQGDYFTTTLGPYDYWAIEYAYKPIDGDEAGELKKIAARAPEHDLVFSTDEDMSANSDPLVNVWDLGADPCRFARDRIALASELMKELDSKVVKDGESWSRARRAFGILLNQWGNAAHLVASHVGGQSVHRDHKGDKDARDPIVPISGDKQREALAFLTDQVLGDKAFSFSPTLLRRLGSEKWYHWGSDGGTGVDFPVHDRVLAIQKIVLGQCLDPEVLTRLQDQELQSEPGSNPLKLSEVFRSLSDGVFAEVKVLPAAPEPKDGKPQQAKLAVSTIRRNLQREYLRRLSGLVLAPSARRGDAASYAFFAGSGAAPADARSLARLHLKEIGGLLDAALNNKDLALDDMTRAHLDECRQRVSQVLDARLDAGGL